ncbi:DUF1178 family protein [Ancylobacter lacus]|uniref:DUF1178 family protein n=1 Tax=Ancylobacter lacus TaxID=2579970 RepID=UPI001BCE2567|nr:DUF1178 family protein [Ancylobacter lacus]MBS7541096.1 DUF1178 family protein [Ancylobacter lacus]
MILYRLVCSAEHEFESWFRDSAAYDDQKARRLVTCPVCASPEVEKAIMAPRLGRAPAEAAPAAAPPPAAAEAAPVALLSEPEQAMREALRALRQHVIAHSDYVGDDFATLARRMHEGEEERRSIHGEASAEEIRGLIEDEIEVHPLPHLPDERN